MGGGHHCPWTFLTPECLPTFERSTYSLLYDMLCFYTHEWQLESNLFLFPKKETGQYRGVFDAFFKISDTQQQQRKTANKFATTFFNKLISFFNKCNKCIFFSFILR